MSLHHLFIGTYTNSGSRGIHALDLDSATGTLGAPRVAAETGNPTYLTLSPDRKFLYAVKNSPALATGYAVGPAGTLTPFPAPAVAPEKEPCYVAIDPAARTLVVAHYHQGYVAALPLCTDGTVGPPRSVVRHAGPGAGVVPARQEKPHTHCSAIAPDGRFVIACDLGLDRIFVYALDAARATLTPAATPFIATAPGFGPRHVAFAPDGRHLFAIGELGGAIVTYAYDAATGALSPRDTHSTLPADFRGTNTAAAVRVHPNGGYIYGSNRGHDSLAVLAFDTATGRLAPVEIVPAGGRGPRDIALSPDGAWLVVANQDSNSLAVFRVDAATGRLTPAPGSAQIPAPVCVSFAG